MIDRKDWEDSAQSFECSLMILRKDKNGWVIGFSVHPNEVPEPLLAAPLGTRFRTVLFQVGDDEKPVVLKEVRDGKKAVAMAGELCRRPSFQEFILSNHDLEPDDDPESLAAEALRARLGIGSRSELAGSPETREAFWTLVRGYSAAGWGDVEIEEDIPY